MAIKIESIFCPATIKDKRVYLLNCLSSKVLLAVGRGEGNGSNAGVLTTLREQSRSEMRYYGGQQATLPVSEYCYKFGRAI